MACTTVMARIRPYIYLSHQLELVHHLIVSPSFRSLANNCCCFVLVNNCCCLDVTVVTPTTCSSSPKQGFTAYKLKKYEISSSGNKIRILYNKMQYIHKYGIRQFNTQVSTITFFAASNTLLLSHIYNGKDI